MARQCGEFMITGTIDNLSFYKMKGEYFVRMKTGVSAAVIKRDPRFAGTRAASCEFGRAGAGSKTLRGALRPLLGIKTGRALNNRLTRALQHVIQTDPLHPRGSRQVVYGDLSRLLNFDFKPESPISGVLRAPFTTRTDREAGRLTVEFDALDSTAAINFPAGATHARMVVAGVNLIGAARQSGFEMRTVLQYSDFLREDAMPAKVTINCSGIDPDAPLLVVLGIEFWQSVAGKMISLGHGRCSAAAVVAVDMGNGEVLEPAGGRLVRAVATFSFTEVSTIAYADILVADLIPP